MHLNTFEVCSLIAADCSVFVVRLKAANISAERVECDAFFGRPFGFEDRERERASEELLCYNSSSKFDEASAGLKTY